MTRSEMALPLKIGNRVIGVLDVQSRQANAFNQDDLETLQVLADQIALAIENARLLADSQQALRELEDLYGVQISQGWQRTLKGMRSRWQKPELHAGTTRRGISGRQPGNKSVLYVCPGARNHAAD